MCAVNCQNQDLRDSRIFRIIDPLGLTIVFYSITELFYYSKIYNYLDIVDRRG